MSLAACRFALQRGENCNLKEVRITHRHASEADLHVRVDEVGALAGEGALDVGQDRVVHLGQPVGAVYLHDEARALTLDWDAARKKEVSGRIDEMMLKSDVYIDVEI